MGFKSPRRPAARRCSRAVEYAAGPPSFWRITLTSGADIELWADGYSVVDDRYVFTVLVRATEHDRRVRAAPAVGELFEPGLAAATGTATGTVL